MAISPQKTHKFILTITTNKKCSRKLALREVRDNVHGLHYCTTIEDGDPDTFRIRSIRHAPRNNGGR